MEEHPQQPGACPPPSAAARPPSGSPNSDGRLTFRASPAVDAWVRERARTEQRLLTDVLAELLAEAYDRSLLEAAPAGPNPKRSKKQQLLDLIEEDCFCEAAAARRLEISARQLVSWLKDPGFCDEVEMAKEAYLSRIEQHLVALGVGKSKEGKAAPLKAFLEAHSPYHGRVKAEVIQRVLNPLLDEYELLIKAECGQEAATRIIKAFERPKEQRLSQFT